MKEKDESKSQDSPPLTKQPDPSPSGNKNNILSAKPQGLPDPAKSPTDGVAPETGLLVPSVQVTDNDGDTRCVDDSGPPKGSSSSANGSPNPSVRDQDSDLEDGEAKRIGEGDPNHVDHDEIIFNHFTAKSFQQLVENEADVKRKAEEKRNRPTEGRLVDGELKFGDEDDEDEAANVRDLSLIEGSNLPEYLAEEFPKDKISVPLEEIDHYLWRNQKTFVVITRRFKQKYLHRFTATKSLFLLAPWNPLRKLALLISTNQIFDYFIIITILVNCIFLALDEDYFPWLTTAEYVFTGIYSCEMIIKVTARGFLLNKYTYLRDAWNWIDFIVIVSAFLTISLEETGSNSLGSLSSLRTFRVLRALKTVSIVPGLKVIISALLRSLRMLAEVVLLQLFCMMVFALFAVQVYVGVLRQKCVQNYPDPLSDVEFADYIKNSSNWYERAPFVYLICGNASGSGRCPDNYTCLQDIGENPNWGYTSFDNFGWAMLTSFQLITLDFWEDAYNKVIRASGPWNIIFFIVVVFFGSFYLVNMMLAVVNMSYEEEVNSNKREKERDKEKQKRKQDKKVAQIAARRDEASLADKHHKDLALSNTNHLQVMSAIKGSSVASNVSLKSVGNGQCTSVSSVGNGVLRNSNANLQEDSKRLRDEAKLVDTSSSKAGNKPKSSAAAASLASSSAIGGDGGGGGGAGAGSPVRGNKRNVSIKGTKDMAEALSGSESSIAKAASKETLGVPLKQELGGGYSNPALTLDQEDTLSLDSENNGDPPVVIVKVRGLTWLGDSSESEQDDDDEELVDRNCAGCSRVCKGYLGWLRCQNALYKVISDLIFEIFVTFCIILNVVFMAIEHHGMSDDLALALKVANYIFTTIFILEAAVKILAMSKHYFRSGWNIFDLIIVAASIIDMGLEDIDGLSVFRAFRLLRLLRVFKLAQTWSTMRMLLSIIMRTLGALGNLTFVLLIVSYIFAVIGMQLFSNSYTAAKFAPDPVPRWNFSDFFHSLMLIFRVLCGEWIEPLWDCMRVEGEICMVVFLPTLVLGNLMVLNLFLALLLNSFATDSLSRGNTSKDSSKMKQGWQRIKGLFKSSKVQPDDRRPSLANIILEVKRQKDEERRKSMQIDGVSQDEKTETSNSNGDIPKTSDVIDVTDSAPNGALSNTSNSKSVDQVLNTNRPKGSAFSNALRKVSMTASDGRRSDKDSIQQSQVEITDAKEDLQSGSEIRMKPAIVINDRRLDDDDDLDGQDEKLPGNIENCLWNCCYEK